MPGSLAFWIVSAIAAAVAAIVVGSFVSGAAMRAAASWFAVYFVIWWIVLFTVLPIGVQSQHETGEVAPGTDPGAPVRPSMGRKVVWTSAISLVVFAGFYAAAPYILP